MLLSVNAFGQKTINESPYLVKWKVDGPILGAALVSYGIGLNKIINIKKPSEESILNLDRNDLKFKINRTIALQNSEKAGTLSDVFLYSSYVGTVALFTGSKKIRNNILPTLIVFAEGYFFTRAATFLSKSTVLRFRPFAYNKNLPLEERQTKGSRTSFFSGHVSTTSYLFFSSAKIFADYYPNAKAKPYVWIGAATIPALTGYLRAKAGKHFIEDVSIGYGVGALFGVLVPHFHKKAKEKSINKNGKASYRIYPAEGGVLLSMKF